MTHGEEAEHHAAVHLPEQGTGALSAVLPSLASSWLPLTPAEELGVGAVTDTRGAPLVLAGPRQLTLRSVKKSQVCGARKAGPPLYWKATRGGTRCFLFFTGALILLLFEMEHLLCASLFTYVISNSGYE